MNIIKASVSGLLLAVLAACANEPPAPTTAPKPLALALAGEHRSAANKARDSARHPAGTLAFLQVEPEHSVVEIWPGGKAWYTEVLAPYVRGQGTLYAAQFHPEAANAYLRKGRADFDTKLAANPEVYDQVVTTILQPGLEINMAPAASVDRVLTFRNVHNWMKMGFAQEIFDASFTVLKPGGMLGVVEHRAAPETSLDDMIRSGYVTEAQVIKYAAAAGFELLASSEVNANLNDVKTYPAGVWSLPPTLRLGEADRDYYLSIGESDRMTLLFKKP